MTMSSTLPANGTILVVDDDREIVRGTMVRLASAGYKPIAAYDGLEAIQRINDDRPDAMLLDVRMPGLDGLGVLEQMRGSTAMSRLPVIMLSASLRDQNKALNAGARYFLPKPYRGEELLQALRGVLTSDGPPGESQAALADQPPSSAALPGPLAQPPGAEAPPPGPPPAVPWTGIDLGPRLQATAVDDVMTAMTDWLCESLPGLS